MAVYTNDYTSQHETGDRTRPNAVFFHCSDPTKHPKTVVIVMTLSHSLSLSLSAASHDYDPDTTHGTAIGLPIRPGVVELRGRIYGSPE